MSSMTLCAECHRLLHSEFVHNHGDYYLCRCGFTQRIYPECEQWCTTRGRYGCKECVNYTCRNNEIKWQQPERKAFTIEWGSWADIATQITTT